MREIHLCVSLFITLAAASSATAQQTLQANDYVAVVGDSITEQKKYSVYIEDYLVMCQPAEKLRQTQFGWSGETSWGFDNRMENDMLRFKATAATTCFGMNDGGYQPMTDQTAKHYREAQTDIVKKMKQAGVRCIVVGSPGCVDVKTFRGGNHEQAQMYNKTLAGLRDIAREVAQTEGVAFADVYDPMFKVMTESEEKFQGRYNLAGGDGVHPDNNGHLVMAYAFLKGLGCKGDIGTITVSLADGKAEATEGHKILSADNGTVEVESSRYPFCFQGEPPRRDNGTAEMASPGSTRDVLQFLPFNQDLNRLMLVVKDAGSGKVKVTWGNASKEFDGGELQKGINLAAEFLDNPFSEPFRRVEDQIRRKQDLETPMVKETINQIPHVVQWAPTAKEALNEAAAKAIESDRGLSDALTVSVVPVEHTIKIATIK